MPDSLGDRMKNNYENRSRVYLTRRMPVIIRIDGNAFHTVLRNAEKPFDFQHMCVMEDVTDELITRIQGCKVGYTQSDEISLLLIDYDTHETQAWFDYNLQKIVSIAAGIATATWNYYVDRVADMRQRIPNPAWFDARAFNLPREEVSNYFLWRQQDWMRNSLQMYARSFFTHKELENKNSAAIHEMLHSVGANWTTDLEEREKNGSFRGTNWSAPAILKENRRIVDDFVFVGE